MKILILEDEPLVAESLRKQVLAIEPTSTILGPIATVSEAAELLAKEMPDLILSDIQLADGISLDLFAEKKIYCPVIFTTAYDEYAMRAFKINSIDYLLKPIDKHELKAAFDQFRNLLDIFGKEPYLKHLNEQFAGFRNTAKYKERFSVHHGRNIVPLSVDEVAFFSKEEVIWLHHRDGKKFLTDHRSLDEVMEIVEPAKFFRANRQYIINRASLGSFRNDESGRIFLRLSGWLNEIIVSKEKASAFRKWLET